MNRVHSFVRSLVVPGVMSGLKLSGQSLRRT